MKQFFKFLFVGLLASVPIEFLGIATAGSNFLAFIPIILLVYTGFLVPVYLSSKMIDRFWSGRRADLIYFFLYGFAWLMVEWFVIKKTAPWAAPEGGLGIMFLSVIFQTGMFIYGATVAFMPRVFISTDSAMIALRRVFIRFYLPFFVVSYFISLLMPFEARFGVAIALIILGHLILGYYYFQHFRKGYSLSFKNFSQDTIPA